MMKESDYNLTVKRTSDLRRLLEMAYLHCWGPRGDPKIRDEFWVIHDNIGDAVPNLGNLTYKGDGRFKWEVIEKEITEGE